MNVPFGGRCVRYRTLLPRVKVQREEECTVMLSKTVTIDTLIQSDLWREFEKTARDRHRRPVDLLADVIADFLATQEGTAVFDDLERDVRHTGYTEDDAVALVKAYRASRSK